MKKLLSVLLVLTLCVAALAAVAEDASNYVPSKTTGDMTVITVTAENLPAGASFAMTTKSAEDMTEAEQTVIATQLEKLKAADSVEKYFAGAVDAEGKTVDLKKLVGSDKLNVYEFALVSAEGYKTEYGTVKMTMQFSTPYEKGSKVAVLVGILAKNGKDVTWTAFEGEVVDNNGSIETELDPDTVEAIQNGTALLAIVSK